MGVQDGRIKATTEIERRLLLLFCVVVVVVVTGRNCEEKEIVSREVARTSPYIGLGCQSLWLAPSTQTPFPPPDPPTPDCLNRQTSSQNTHTHKRFTDKL